MQMLIHMKTSIRATKMLCSFVWVDGQRKPMFHGKHIRIW
jgi:hypothetical protein